MDFRILGPLEVLRDGEVVPLSGVKQRATLGYLLLNANRVVATSQLLGALWPMDTAPVSARKVLHNAVWGLRRMVDGSAAALLTQPPGYKLAVDPEQIDIHRFQRLVTQGRAELDAAEPLAAAATLRRALGLWRGCVLADLAEAGIVWPELAVLRNARLDAMDDYRDAELASGRHHTVLAELKATVAEFPLRERSCTQLMLAFYRCGRQADALAVYSRLRSTLVEELGLEPSRETQALQQAILSHSSSLDLSALSVPPATIELATQRSGEQAQPVPPEPAVLRPVEVPASAPVSVVLVQTKLGPALVNAEPSHLARTLERIGERIRAIIEYYGGKVTASTGLVTMARFQPWQRENDKDGPAARAVLATLAMRDELRTRKDGPTFHAAVATGVVAGAAVSSTSGTLADRCHSLLATADAGHIRLCQDTRLAAESIVTQRPARGQDTYRPAERDFEVNVVRGLLERSRHRHSPYLVTVLGEQGTGKSTFLSEVGGLAGDMAVVRTCPDGEPDVAQLMTAWRRTGPARPTLLLVDDLHLADDDALDLVDGLAQCSADSGPALFVVATARPELLRRRPEWGAGKRDATSITLARVPDPAVEVLWHSLLHREPDFGLELVSTRRPA